MSAVDFVTLSFILINLSIIAGGALGAHLASFSRARLRPGANQAFFIAVLVPFVFVSTQFQHINLDVMAHITSTNSGALISVFVSCYIASTAIFMASVKIYGYLFKRVSTPSDGIVGTDYLTKVVSIIVAAVIA